MKDNPTRSKLLSMRAVEWCLRVTVALQCIGVGCWTSSTETPNFETLCYAWEWPEETVVRLESASVYMLLGSSAILLFSPLVLRSKLNIAVSCITSAAVTAWQIWIAFVTWYQAEGLPEGYFAWLVFAEQAVRIGAPLGLLLWILIPWERRSSENDRQSPELSCWLELPIWLLRLCAASTFLAHGYEAWIHHPPFIDLIIGAGLSVGWRIEQAAAEQMLVAIGAIDFVLSAMLLLGRFRSVVLYMSMWGLLTASSRIVHSGFGAYFETLMRAANAGAPLAIVVYWHTTASARRQSVSAIES